MPIDEFQRLGFALAIGFLIGVERGWRARDEADGARTAGVRTYALIGLLGGVAGELGRVLGGWAFAAVALPMAAAFIMFKLREQAEEQDYSVTAVVAALLAFGLGAYAVAGDWRAACAAAVATTALLAFKGVLHGWLRRLTWPELRSALILLAMTFVALPLLPDRAMGPYGAFNPYELWLLTIALAGVSFVAYAAIKVAGPTRGAMLGAAAGALISSTAVTLDLARRSRSTPQAAAPNAGAALVAGAMMAARMGVIVAVIAPVLLWRLGPALAGFAAVSAGVGALLARRARTPAEAPAPGPVKSPFDLLAVARFAVLLGAVMAAAKVVSALYGPEGLVPVAIATGLVDVDALTLTASRLTLQGLAPAAAITAILAAGAADTVSKAVLGLAVGGLRFGGLFIAGSALAAAAASALFLAPWPVAS